MNTKPTATSSAKPNAQPSTKSSSKTSDKLSDKLSDRPKSQSTTTRKFKQRKTQQQILDEYEADREKTKRSTLKVHKPPSKEELLHGFYHPKSGSRFEVLYNLD